MQAGRVGVDPEGGPRADWLPDPLMGSLSKDPTGLMHRGARALMLPTPDSPQKAVIPSVTRPPHLGSSCLVVAWGSDARGWGGSAWRQLQGQGRGRN